MGGRLSFELRRQGLALICARMRASGEPADFGSRAQLLRLGNGEQEDGSNGARTEDEGNSELEGCQLSVGSGRWCSRSISFPAPPCSPNFRGR
jgi:hypothetical protein